MCEGRDICRNALNEIIRICNIWTAMFAAIKSYHPRIFAGTRPSPSQRSEVVAVVGVRLG